MDRLRDAVPTRSFRANKKPVYFAERPEKIQGAVEVDNTKVSWKPKFHAFVALVAYAAASNGAIPTQYQGVWAKAAATEEVGWMLNAAQTGDEAEAQQLKSTLDVAPKPARGNRTAARALHDAGLKLLRSGDKVSAIDQLTKAAELDRGDAEILGNLGFALLMSGQPDKARAAIEEALMLAPGRSASWGNLGEAYAGLGDEVSALAAFRLTYLFSRNKDKTIAYFDMLISKPDAPKALVSAATTAREVPTISPPGPSAPGGTSQEGATSGQIAAGDTIGYGSRAGMEVTVVSADGLDTARAVIRTKHTRKNAVAFCRDYVLKVSEACIAETLAIPLKEEIAANCQTGEFVDFSGARYRYEGPAPKRNDDYMPDYRLRSLKTGELADGSMASGYPVNLAIFRALCPSGARGTLPQGSVPHTTRSTTPLAPRELDQIRRHYVKNVNFPKAYAGRLLTVTGTAAATNPRSSYRGKIEMPQRGGEDVTAWCLTTTGTIPVGSSVTATGTLSESVYTHDEGGEAFYLKDCALRPAQ